MLEERGIEHAAGSQAWLRRTLEEIVSQVRRLLDVTGVSFLVVDAAHAHIRPAASWFASDAVRDAFVPVLDRPYEPERAGVTEAAIETRQPGADRADRGLAGRRRPARPPVRAPRRRPRRAAVGLVQLVLVPLLPGAHARRAHPGRARASPARCRSPPSAPRTCASPRCSPTSPRSRSSAPSCSTTRRRSAAPRGRSARRSTRPRSWPRRSSRRAR